MGREIRRVPKNWEHPKDDDGHYQPLYDSTYEEAAREWMKGLQEWEAGERERVREEYGKDYFFWEWGSGPPKREWYRPAFEEEPTCYQIYETVSEGTPVSPVFETKDELIDWLTSQGHTRHAAESFADSGWAPSAIVYPSRGIVAMNIDMYDYDDELEEG